MALQDWLDKTVTFQRETVGKSASGGLVKEPWTPRMTVAAAVYPSGVGLRSTFRPDAVGDPFNRRDLLAWMEVATAVDVDAQAGDRMEVDGRFYEVIGYHRYENAHLNIPSVYITFGSLRNQ